MADMNTNIRDLPNLPKENFERLTDKAKTLTKTDLIRLGKNKVNEPHLESLTVSDLKSIEYCFENYGIDVGNGAVGAAACSSSVVCCCCGASTVKPVK